MFQNMRLGKQLQTPRTQPPGGGSNLDMYIEQQETLKEMASDPSILGLYLSSHGPWEVVEGIAMWHIKFSSSWYNIKTQS